MRNKIILIIKQIDRFQAAGANKTKYIRQMVIFIQIMTKPLVEHRTFYIIRIEENTSNIKFKQIIITLMIQQYRGDDEAERQRRRIISQKSIINTTLQYLEKQLMHNPHTQSIELEFMQLGDIKPLIDTLKRFTKLKKLSFHGNRLKELSYELKELVHLQEIDISNNMLINVEVVTSSLKGIPKLTKLITSFKGTDQQYIKAELTNLQYFNNSKILRQKRVVEVKRTNKYQIRDQHWIKSAKMFDKIREIYKKSYKKNNDRNNKMEFDEETKESMRKMNSNLQENKNAPDNVLSGIYLTTRYSLFKEVENKLIDLVTNLEPEYGNLLVELFDEYAIIISCFGEVAVSKPAAVPSATKVSKEAQFQTVQKQLKRLRKQRDDLANEIQSLEAQNKNYIDALVRVSKGQKISVVNYKTSRNNQSPTRRFQATDRTKVSTSNVNKEYGISSGGVNGKTLTLRQLKQFISEIYDSKFKFDQKLNESKQARQTMYEYLFTFLNQKYGLKSLIIDWASSVVSGIQKYSSEDNDVAVFGKVLKNQCEQEFRDVQTEVKSATQQLLKLHIQNRFPLKLEADIRQILQSKKNGYLTSEEAEDIVGYCFKQNQAAELIDKFNILYAIQPRTETTDKKHNRGESSVTSDKKSLKYSLFQKCILDYQLRSHQKYLKPITQAFQRADKDADGIINEKQFTQLLQEMCQDSDKYLNSFLNMIDPNETDVITYSQVVQLFSNYPEGNPILSRFAEYKSS